MKAKKPLILLAVVLVVAGGVYRWKTRKEKAPEFQAVPVQRGDLRVTIQSTGIIQPQNRLEIKPPIAGRVEKVLVKEGESVRAGQVLAWMSSTERAALLDAARAKGADELRHWEDLYKPTPLIASLGGTIIARNVEPGQTITTQDPVLVMSDRLIVKAQVDETDIGSVRLGQSTELSLDAYPQDVVPGKVDHIAFEAKTVNNVTMYEVDVLPAHVPDFMRSGMTANVTFVISSRENALLVPSEAIRERDGKSAVRKPAPQGEKPERVEIETGLTDGKNTEVTSGLSEGDMVLVPSMPSSIASKGGQGANPFSPFRRRSGTSGQGRRSGS